MQAPGVLNLRYELLLPMYEEYEKEEIVIDVKEVRMRGQGGGRVCLWDRIIVLVLY